MSNKQYTMDYNFGVYQDSLENFFNTLTVNSIDYFTNQVKQRKIILNKYDINSKEFEKEFDKEYYIVIDLIKNVEEYLYYYYSKDSYNFPFVFNAVKQLNSISVLDDTSRNRIYGITLPSNRIEMRPYFTENQYLTSNQRRRLYVAHELGHLVNKQWLKNVDDFLLINNVLDNDQKDFFKEGFSLVDEATTQNRAEDIAYFYAHEDRPRLKSFIDTIGMYNGQQYKTNFDYYGELQEPAIMFARTLRGIGKIEDDSTALSTLSKRALNPNFANNIINEYQRDGQMVNLYNEFQYLGIIKKASYARFGNDDVKYIRASGNTLKKLKNISYKLRDYREPFDSQLSL